MQVDIHKGQATLKKIKQTYVQQYTIKNNIMADAKHCESLQLSLSWHFQMGDKRGSCQHKYSREK